MISNVLLNCKQKFNLDVRRSLVHPLPTMTSYGFFPLNFLWMSHPSVKHVFTKLDVGSSNIFSNITRISRIISKNGRSLRQTRSSRFCTSISHFIASFWRHHFFYEKIIFDPIFRAKGERKLSFLHILTKTPSPTSPSMSCPSNSEHYSLSSLWKINALVT